jgi:hypothetical protein
MREDESKQGSNMGAATIVSAKEQLIPIAGSIGRRANSASLGTERVHTKLVVHRHQITINERVE